MAKVTRHARPGVSPGKRRQAQARRRPPGQGPGGYAGAEGESDGYAGAEGETVVVCEAVAPTGKKKFPWGTILLTGVVTTIGGLIVMEVYKKTKGEPERQPNPGSSLGPAPDFVYLPGDAPPPPPPPAPVTNPGPTSREVMLFETNAQLRADLAQMEGFIRGQQAAQPKPDTLSDLIDAAEAD